MLPQGPATRIIVAPNVKILAFLASFRAILAVFWAVFCPFGPFWAFLGPFGLFWSTGAREKIFFYFFLVPTSGGPPPNVEILVFLASFRAILAVFWAVFAPLGPFRAFWALLGLFGPSLTL